MIPRFSSLSDETITLLDSERPKLYTTWDFLSAIGLNMSPVSKWPCYWLAVEPRVHSLLY